MSFELCVNMRLLIAGSAAIVLLACATAHSDSQPLTSSVADGSPPAKRKPEVGAFGFELDGMDRSVAPGDDFVRYAIGRWIDTTEIPPDRPSISAVGLIREQTATRVRDIIEDAAKANAPEGSEARKI